MKKIIILLVLLVTGISFSDTCKWIKNPNVYVLKEIELINKSRLIGNVYCDVEHDFMTYYVGIDNLEVGLVYNTRERKELTYENIFKILAIKQILNFMYLFIIFLRRINYQKNFF